LARNGKIDNYEAATIYYDQMQKETSEDWNYYEKKYKPIFRKLTKEFQSLAPKDHSQNIIIKKLDNSLSMDTLHLHKEQEEQEEDIDT